ncbi:MAG: hypothetical protein DLM50_02310 [Candidatus Meridianibacter frigidus]|nr:MAG: hypothetical protein DLM50_02310 [Candidatus Eremiobacteraeota bacterium]
MSSRALAITLKIPDNEAFTALRALQRLHIPVAAVERAEVWIFESSLSDEALVEGVRANETLFNPNKHELRVLRDERPRDGEVWIGEQGEDPASRAKLGGKPLAGVTAVRRYTAWLLSGEEGAALPRDQVDLAARGLLCNPAIEKAIL